MGKFGNSHEEYFNKKGNEVPSVTTILKILNKPSLQKWANFLGFKRQNVDAVLDEAASKGTNVHNIISAYLTKTEYKPEYKYPGEYEKVKLTINNFYLWMKEHKPEVIFSEKKFIGELYGGTLDFYGKIDDKLTLLDFKTSKNFYPSMFLQLGAYITLLEEAGYMIDQVAILIINENGSKYKTIERSKMDPYVKAYNDLAKVYHMLFELDSLNKENGIGLIIEKK